VKQYFRAIAYEDLKAAVVDEELSQFNFRPDSERTKAPNAFWADEGRRYLHLARFRKDVLQVLCTEAAVERSFAVEGEPVLGLSYFHYRYGLWNLLNVS
jgi:hypothetical protein